MRIHICAVGRLRSGPEAVLVADYLQRFTRSGRALGLGPAQIHEVETRGGAGGRDEESGRLQRTLPEGAMICALDERGTTLTSPEFAQLIAGWRDSGQRDAAFVIGGADGLAAELRRSAHFSLSFGSMVWPHLLVRVMLAEQLYRAASILAGAPYHRV